MTFTKDFYTEDELCELCELNKTKWNDVQNLTTLMEYQKQVGSMKGKTWDEIADWGIDEGGFCSVSPSFFFAKSKKN